MEPKLTNLFLFLSVAAVISSLSAAALQTQSLFLHSLPHPPTLSWPESQSLESDPGSSDAISLDLHHLDAISSNKSPEQLFNLRLQRDAARVQSFTSMVAQVASLNQSLARGSVGSGGSGFSSSVISGLAQGSGEYFTRLGVGTPPRYLYMVLDTGSDVVWLQCSPCRKCYAQTDPMFDPRKSTSFAGVTCGSPLCRRLDSPGCNSKKSCLYQVSYGDGSFTVGDFSTETLTFRRTKVPGVALGCGHDNEGLFVGAAGLLGLGRGKLSFPVQSGRRFNQKFSYCLVDRSASAKPSSIVFGDSAVPRTALFTPLLNNPKLDTFYYVELLGISVGGSPVRGISPSLFRLTPAGDGGVIIDSGTSVTRLTRPAYIALRNAFRVGASHLKKGEDFSLFDTCFDLSGQTEVKVPTVALHFRGADVSLPANNYLIPVDSKGTFCFAFAGTMSGLSIIGNIQQQGFRVVYDLAGSRVGFAPRGGGTSKENYLLKEFKVQMLLQEAKENVIIGSKSIRSDPMKVNKKEHLQGGGEVVKICKDLTNQKGKSCEVVGTLITRELVFSESLKGSPTRRDKIAIFMKVRHIVVKQQVKSHERVSFYPEEATVKTNSNLNSN
ncbi:aspartyl protease family protein 2-like [Senna tora]|uniref:Aspartyl protease family protein 2-like n=1 Tax=Senna tora TaxID=362788 RepID=A0A834WQT4_9FABA|nr:aspartyl protease family protein 2-like [Senna tora]